MKKARAKSSRVRLDGLLPQHEELLHASAISAEVAVARGYRSVTSPFELNTVGFGRGQMTVPALLIPVYGPGGARSGYQTRPDTPRTARDGRVVKYEVPQGSRSTLDVPPGVRDRIGDPAIPLFVTEGIRKADSAVSRGLCCVALFGVWNWRGTNELGGSVALAEWESIALKDRKVYIAFDSDITRKRSVRSALDRLRGFLQSRGAEVFVVEFPEDGGAKVGLDDFFASGRTVEDLLSLAKEVPNPALDPRPVITVRNEMNLVVDEAQAALLADPESGIFSRSGLLVRVVRNAGPRLPGVTRPLGSPVIVPIEVAYLRERLDRAARWVRETDSKPALPPAWVAEALAARLEWPFPPLEGVVETPTLRPDGSVLSEAGYDAATGLLFEPAEATFPPVLDSPSRGDAREALAALETPFRDFPFVDATDRAAVVADVLTVLGRPAIPGPVPARANRAPVPGAGKTLLADAVSMICTGRAAPRMTDPGDDGETRKRLLALALEGSSIVLIDNVEDEIGSASLAAALTGTELKDRLLGGNRMVTVPLRALWIITGNNLRLKGDLGRRVVPCDLDPRMEHPEDRTRFGIADLLAHLRTERPRYVHAALTVLRGYVVAGRPPHAKPAKGSFESWDRLVRGALIWAGSADPLGGTERIRREGDAELEALRAALGAWREKFREESKSAAEVFNNAGGEFLTTLSQLAKCDPVRLSPNKLGYALRKAKGRVVAGRRFESAGLDRNGLALWRVVTVEGPRKPSEPSAGDAGDAGDRASRNSEPTSSKARKRG